MKLNRKHGERQRVRTLAWQRRRINGAWTGGDVRRWAGYAFSSPLLWVVRVAAHNCGPLCMHAMVDRLLFSDAFALFVLLVSCLALSTFMVSLDHVRTGVS